MFSHLHDPSYLSSHFPEPVVDLESTTLINLEEENSSAAATSGAKDAISADEFEDFLSAVTAGSSQSSGANYAVPPSVPVSTPNITTASFQTTSNTQGINSHNFSRFVYFLKMTFRTCFQCVIGS